MSITATQKMGVAALIMAGSVFLSRIMGLVRDKVVSWKFGAGAESDIYFSAFVVPDFLNHLLAGGYISITLIPLLAAAFKEDKEDGLRFFGAVVCWAGTGITILSCAAFCAAPTLVPFIAPGFDESQLVRLADFLRIIIPAQIFFIVGACLTAVLYIRRQFLVPALTPIVYNGCIILGGILLPLRGMEGFCWGVLVGAFLGAFLLPLAAVYRGGFTFIAGWRHPRLIKLVWLALPLMIGLSVTAVDEQLVRIFGSMAGDGAVSLLNYARRIMMVPVGVVAQAAGVASFPFLAALVADRNETGFAETLHRAVRGSLYVVIPLTFLMIAVAASTLGFLFEGGRFGFEETFLAAPLLQIMLLAVPFWTIQQVIGRAFYARGDTLTPAVVGSIATIAAVIAYPFAVRTWGTTGVAVMTALSVAVYTAALCCVWVRRFGASAFDGYSGMIFRPLFIGFLACAAALSVQNELRLIIDTWASAVSIAISGGCVSISAAWIGYIFNGMIGCAVFVPMYVCTAFLFCREILRVRKR